MVSVDLRLSSVRLRFLTRAQLLTVLLSRWVAEHCVLFAQRCQHVFCCFAVGIVSMRWFEHISGAVS